MPSREVMTAMAMGNANTPMPTIKSDYIKSWTRDPKAGDMYYKGEGSGTGWYPIWRSEAEAKLQGGINNVDPNKTSGGFTGVDYNYFTDLLKKQMETGDPNQALYRQNAQTQVNRGVDTSGERLKEQLAQSGMSRSGVATGAMANLEMGRADALGNVETQLATQDQAFRQNALAKLLGLQELGLQELGQNRSYYTQQLGMQLGQENWNKQFDYQKDQDKFSFGRDALPGIINGVGQVGLALATGGASIPFQAAGAAAGASGKITTPGTNGIANYTDPNFVNNYFKLSGR